MPNICLLTVNNPSLLLPAPWEAILLDYWTSSPPPSLGYYSFLCSPILECPFANATSETPLITPKMLYQVQEAISTANSINSLFAAPSSSAFFFPLLLSFLDAHHGNGRSLTSCLIALLNINLSYAQSPSLARLISYIGASIFHCYIQPLLTKT